MAEIKWLSVEEQQTWLALVEMMVRVPAQLDGQLRKDAGISHFEYAVLARVSEASERTLRMSELAELANGSLSRLSHTVKRLEARGWLSRRPCPSDGRLTEAVLTDEGWEKVVATAPGHVAAVRALVVDVLTEEQQRELRSITGAIAANLASDGEGRGGLRTGPC